jgi:hypothetical protein
MSEKIWVTYGRTESGDDLQVIVWNRKPTHDEVDAAYKEIYEIEYEEVGFVNWTIETAIQRNV